MVGGNLGQGDAGEELASIDAIRSGVRVGGIKAQSLLEASHGLGGAAAFQQHTAEHVPDLGLIAIHRQSPAQQIFGLLHATLGAAQMPQIGQRHGVVRLEFAGPGQQGLGLRQATEIQHQATQIVECRLEIRIQLEGAAKTGGGLVARRPQKGAEVVVNIGAEGIQYQATAKACNRLFCLAQVAERNT